MKVVGLTVWAASNTETRAQIVRIACDADFRHLNPNNGIIAERLKVSQALEVLK